MVKIQAHRFRASRPCRRGLPCRKELSVKALGDKPLTADGTFTYAYDALSRLTAAYSNGTLVVSNRYDHLGRRVVKIAADDGHQWFASGATAGRRRYAGVRDEVKELMILSEEK